MTAIRIAVHTLIRAGAIALIVLAYDLAYDQAVTPTSGDADIGKGLLAFLLIATVCLTWGLLDGLLLPPLVWCLAWVVAGLTVGIGWELVISDGSLEGIESGSVVFITLLVAVPGLVGAGFGWLVGGRNRTPVPADH